MKNYPIRFTQDGLIFLGPEDDCDTVVDIMLDINYSEEFCVAFDWDPDFIVRLIKAGFLVMSEQIFVKDEKENIAKRAIVLPKLHLVRSALFFHELHIKKSVKRFLDRYELLFDGDFETIVQKCIAVHGDFWLTPALLEALCAIRSRRDASVRPVSFGVYRDGKLVAGEFGVISGRVYTSYSGYHDEDNSGTVQMILMARYLEKAGFDFLDFGMPLDYKTGLGARNISPENFVALFRAAQNTSGKNLL
ncbi:MAG: GNAT family N-acetyltransferase [Treponema sp.]|jgi:Leu/Phe-tRNA-protein transferase|nr:GNAT family N-acetyltransferase [Treponema sp.]